MVHNWSSDRLPDLTPLKLDTAHGVKEIKHTGEYMWLGFGILDNKPLSLVQHLKIRNLIRDKAGYFAKVRRLR